MAEQTAHNRLVPGSNPGGPTLLITGDDATQSPFSRTILYSLIQRLTLLLAYNLITQLADVSHQSVYFFLGAARVYVTGPDGDLAINLCCGWHQSTFSSESACDFHTAIYLS